MQNILKIMHNCGNRTNNIVHTSRTSNQFACESEQIGATALFDKRYIQESLHCLVASPGGWYPSQTYGAGPAPPPAPAMTSPARASTWISL
jgi:hypothetical protein